MKIVRTALLGLGTVNVGFLKILVSKKDYLAEKYGVSFLITAVADSSGIAVNPHGFSYDEIITLKAAKNKVSVLPGFVPGISSELLPQHSHAELLVESSSVNMDTGFPGLQAAKNALTNEMHVVFANKAPLVFAFKELHELAGKNNCRIAYSATVCGGLPVINVLQRDLAGASLKRFSGILNCTTNHILQAIESGGSMEEGVKEAQRVGAAEADPIHDTSGHDTANKLFIIMKSFSNFSGTINDITVEGITSITAELLHNARKRGKVIKLLALAEPAGNFWKLSVKPTEVNTDSFLGSCNGWEMGIELETDYYEKIAMKIYEKDPMATSAAVLRDALNTYKKSLS